MTKDFNRDDNLSNNANANANANGQTTESTETLKSSAVNITMIGTGYVGLVSGACFSALGHRVTCLDNDVAKIAKLKKAIIPIYEIKLKDLVDENLAQKRLSFSTDLKSAIETAEVIFVAVGTPPCPVTGKADLQYVEGLARELAPLLTSYKVIVLKSTVPIGTGHRFKKIMQTINPEAKFDMVSNPEFLREGSAVSDFMNPDRIVIGSETKRSQNLMDRIYQPFLKQNIPILHTDIESSELIKYAANCFLATKIAFVNEIADLCEETGANIESVTEGLGLDRRIGPGYLQPGPGFGGSCFPKDTLALIQIAEALSCPLSVVEAVVRSNENRKKKMVQKILHICGGEVEGKRLAILGVAFKANTDDIRESSAMIIIEDLQKLGAKLRVYDPAAMEKASLELPAIEWSSSVSEAMKDAEAVIIITEWQEFKNLRFNNGINQHKKPIIIDLRNLYDLKEMQGIDINYHSIGRPAVKSVADVPVPEVLIPIED